MELSKLIQTFYKTVIDSSSDEESDDDFELMMAAAMLLHEHTWRPVYRGSVKGRKPNVKCNREKGHYQLFATTSILTIQSSVRKNFGAATGCQGSCF
jgi:hypothetical protein